MNDVAVYLFVLVISFSLHFAFFIPFINYLYARRMQRVHQETMDPFGRKTPIFDLYNVHKVGTPVGGGILVIGLTTLTFLCCLIWFVVTNRSITANYPSPLAEIIVLLYSMLSFGVIGLYDDLTKIFKWQKNQFFGLRLRQKLILELLVGLSISLWLYFVLGIDFIHVPFFGTLPISYGYIIFATFVIVAFANAVNITDGMDGLSMGVLMISLIGFWIIARTNIDVPSSVFIAVWIGGLLAFLYFNVFPARIMLGDTGALSFGATFAVVGLILGKPFALPLIGGIFLIEVASSAIQLTSKRLLKKKVFHVSPFHLYLQYRGWQEPKIVFRMWIFAIVFVVLGVAVALIL